MKFKIFLALGFLSVSLSVPFLMGCLYNVRDIGFTELDNNPYILFGLVDESTSPEFIRQFKTISNSVFMDTNIEAELIDIENDQGHPYLEDMLSLGIGSYPAAVLASPTGRLLNLTLSESTSDPQKSLRAVVNAIVDSTSRDRILDQIVEAYCIVLLAEGRSAAENRSAHQIIEDVTGQISRSMGQLPKRIEQPPAKVVIPHNLRNREKILLWSLGLDSTTAETPSIVIIYGRGRKFGPVLQGETIEKSRLFNILSIIGLSCECGLEREVMLGTRLPLRWDRKLRRESARSLGFDVDSPMVKAEMNAILASSAAQTGIPSQAGQRDPSGLYTEESAKETSAAFSSSRISPAMLNSLEGSSRPLNQDTYPGSFKSAAIFLSTLGALILFTGGLIWLRGRKKVQ